MLLVLIYPKNNQKIEAFQLHKMIVHNNQMHLIIVIIRHKHNKFRIKNKNLI